jgi:zinc-ribbon domain
MKCPKCNSEASDAARFCPRCHSTLRFECPACHHEQREGGRCEKCGVDFMKYITAVLSTKKAEADAEHERSMKRSRLLKNLLLSPFTMGIPLIRDLFVSSRKGRA